MKHLADHKLNRLNYNTYVKTRAHNKAETLLDDLGVVILVGSPGSGKSTLGLHLMAHIKNTKKRQVLLLQHPSQFEDISIPPSMVNIEQEEKLVIMIDDIFGRTNLIGEYEQ
ncbi:uncharacterized protein LOC121367177, partial [Gigantopelta aegis]|uniref:uncharacterized protein LOC121367177 n=1 Tax=Gigantopelta aegis TaxID=1735272 RepID=UPI001B88A9D0